MLAQLVVLVLLLAEASTARKVLEALAPHDVRGAWVPVDVDSLSQQVQLTAASLPDDALPGDDCATLVAGLQLANGAVSVTHVQEAVDGMPLSTLVVNGDVIHTESFSTLTATVGVPSAPDAITVTYHARQGSNDVERYTISVGQSTVLKLTARAGEPHMCVSGSVNAAL